MFWTMIISKTFSTWWDHLLTNPFLIKSQIQKHRMIFWLKILTKITKITTIHLQFQAKNKVLTQTKYSILKITHLMKHHWILKIEIFLRKWHSVENNHFSTKKMIQITGHFNKELTYSSKFSTPNSNIWIKQSMSFLW